MLKPVGLLVVLLLVPSWPVPGPAPLVEESFEDGSFKARGWYDNTAQIVTTREHHGGKGALEMAFLVGKTTAVNGGGMRRIFPATDRVYLRYWVKYSDNWVGSRVAYHPHEFHFLTNLDPAFIGPAATHLTTYTEHNYQRGGGVPRLAIQDGLNIDTSKIGVDLTNVTERRAVSGCNGSGVRPLEDCYRAGGGAWANGKGWNAAAPAFTESGPGFKGAWHKVEAYFQLNSVVSGKAVADGVVQYWFDGKLLIDHHDVFLRTGIHPEMRFNQFLIAPYIGVGSPVEQTMWVDDLLIATGRMN